MYSNNIYIKTTTKSMIFLANNTVKSFKIGRNWSYPVVNLTLTLFNRYTNEKTIFNMVDFEDNELYYIIKNIDLSKLNNGEYEYTLLDNTNEVILSVGIIQIGPRDTSNTEYLKKEQFIEYTK